MTSSTRQADGFAKKGARSRAPYPSAKKNTAEAVARVVAAYREHAKKGERLGKTIERLGLEPFREAL